MQNNEEENKPDRTPDDTGQILVDEHVKIFDPNSGSVFLDKRETN